MMIFRNLFIQALIPVILMQTQTPTSSDDNENLQKRVSSITGMDRNDIVVLNTPFEQSFDSEKQIYIALKKAYIYAKKPKPQSFLKISIKVLMGSAVLFFIIKHYLWGLHTSN